MTEERRPLSGFEQELFRDVIDTELVQRGLRTKRDFQRFSGMVARLPKDVRELIAVAYLMGWNDAVSRIVYGDEYGVYSVSSGYAKRMRDDFEGKFIEHRDDQLNKENREKD